MEPPNDSREPHRFRKRPVVIEAARVNGVSGAWMVMRWIEQNGGRCDKNQDGLSIETMEGWMHASHGDWVIRGVAGEFYPCKPDIFEQTYEPADAE